MGQSSAAPTSQQPSSWLVDADFRSRFVEKTRGVSSTNLSGLGKSKSTVRFVDQPPGRRATSGAADLRVAAPAPNATRDAEATEAQTRPRRDSHAIADEDDDDLLMMGRKDGVTKAGTIKSKARGKQRSSPNNSDGFRYQSPPTPPLY